MGGELCRARQMITEGVSSDFLQDKSMSKKGRGARVRAGCEGMATVCAIP